MKGIDTGRRWQCGIAWKARIRQRVKPRVAAQRAGRTIDLQGGSFCDINQDTKMAEGVSSGAELSGRGSASNREDVCGSS